MRNTLIAAAIAAGFLCGCTDPGPEVVPVSGTLMRDGKPVGNLDVTFKPVQGRPSFGEADGNGRFTLKYTRDQDGAVVGTHTVWVIWKHRSAADEFAGKRPEAEVLEILKEYGSEDRTKLTNVEITEATDNLIINLD